MPGFDKSLDKESFSKSIDFDKSKITVAVFSYNGGKAKLQLSRENKGAEGQATFAKLGRLTKEEVEKVIPLMQEASQFL